MNARFFAQITARSFDLCTAREINGRFERLVVIPLAVQVVPGDLVLVSSGVVVEIVARVQRDPEERLRELGYSYLEATQRALNTFGTGLDVRDFPTVRDQRAQLFGCLMASVSDAVLVKTGRKPPGTALLDHAVETVQAALGNDHGLTEYVRKVADSFARNHERKPSEEDPG